MAEISTTKRSINFEIDFALNSFEISPFSLPMINNLAEALASPELQCDRFEIRGYSDVAEHVGFSMELSLLRAGRVMQYLINKGISKDRLLPRGSGAQTKNPKSSVRFTNVGAIKGCSEKRNGNE